MYILLLIDFLQYEVIGDIFISKYQNLMGDDFAQHLIFECTCSLCKKNKSNTNLTGL